MTDASVTELAVHGVEIVVSLDPLNGVSQERTVAQSGDAVLLNSDATRR